MEIVPDWQRLYSTHGMGRVVRNGGRGRFAREDQTLLGEEHSLSDSNRREWLMTRTVREDDMVTRYSQIQGRVEYVVAAEKGMSPLHIGQFKLFFSELEFLTRHAHQADLILYVGAAEGYHTGFMANLFPQHTFHLWDPRPFDIPPRDNVILFQKLFTDGDAEGYAGQKLLLITDIRNAEFRERLDEEDPDGAESVILRDLKLQEGWVRTIRPVASSIKMRLPYYPGQTETLDGEVYLQPYSPASTETRLHIVDPDSRRVWDHTEYDERMAYFNLKIRPGKHDSRWGKIMDKCGLVHSWDNAMALTICEKYLEMRGRKTDGNSICKFFTAIFRYHRRRYGRKYDIVKS